MPKNQVVKEATILIVDDQASVRHLVAEFLRTEISHVIVAESGQRALDLVETEKIDLILLDLQMPGMDGLATLKALRDKGFSGKVVIMSAFNEREIVGDIKGLGVSQVLVKPFDIYELKEVLYSSLTERFPKIYCLC